MNKVLKIGTVATDNSAFGRVQVRAPGDTKQPWIHFKSQEEFQQFTAIWRDLQAPFLMEFDDETRTWAAHNHFRALAEETFVGRLRSIGPMPDQTRNEIACKLLGHSPVGIFTEDGSYVCSRCGNGMEDKGRVFSDVEDVAALHWADRLFVVGEIAHAA